MHNVAAVPHTETATRPFYINGEWREGSEGEIDKNINPATGKVCAIVAQASAEDVDDAITAAFAARLSWRKMVVSEREGILLKAADIIAERADEIRDIIIEETGSTLLKAPWEVGYAIDCLRSAAAWVRQAHGETFPTSSPGQIGMTVRQPLGVIAGIAPFNSPLLLSMKKVAFALASGNTFILKPSEFAPLTGLVLADIFQAAGLPKGVFNVVPGSADNVGKRLVADPRVKMITFTGSARVGKVLAAECGKQMKKVTLELGGKSPLVVLDDADLKYAVDAAAFGIFFHQGQVCMSNSRIIVEQGLYDTFCKAFVAKANAVVVGDPRHPDTVIGPLIRPEQCIFIADQISEATDKGARVLCGGTYEDSYFQPTVLADVTDQMRIYSEESFGPITSIYSARDFDHAVELANDTHYGLSSAIITNDLQKAMAFTELSTAGMIHINDTTISDEPHITFGGCGDSGFGREGGRASMEEMTEVKWVTIQTGKREFPF
jgi:aldehyde dehydrogenase (NAD+)